MDETNLFSNPWADVRNDPLSTTTEGAAPAITPEGDALATTPKGDALATTGGAAPRQEDLGSRDPRRRRSRGAAHYESRPRPSAQQWQHDAPSRDRGRVRGAVTPTTHGYGSQSSGTLLPAHSRRDSSARPFPRGALSPEMYFVRSGRGQSAYGALPPSQTPSTAPSSGLGRSSYGALPPHVPTAPASWGPGRSSYGALPPSQSGAPASTASSAASTSAGRCPATSIRAAKARVMANQAAGTTPRSIDALIARALPEEPCANLGVGVDTPCGGAHLSTECTLLPLICTACGEQGHTHSVCTSRLYCSRCLKTNTRHDITRCTAAKDRYGHLLPANPQYTPLVRRSAAAAQPLRRTAGPGPSFPGAAGTNTPLALAQADTGGKRKRSQLSTSDEDLDMDESYFTKPVVDGVKRRMLLDEEESRLRREAEEEEEFDRLHREADEWLVSNWPEGPRGPMA